MDLTIEFDQCKLNLRTSVLIKKGNEWLLHQSKNENFATTIGGRIKLDEDSRTAAIRELEEELNVRFDESKLKFLSVMENFFTYDSKRYHELLFVYLLEVTDELGHEKIYNQPDESFDFFFCNNQEIERLIIKPEKIKTMILNNDIQPHIFNREN